MRPARNLRFLIFLVAMVAPSGIRGQSEPLRLCYAPDGILPESCVSFFPYPISKEGFEFPEYTAGALVGMRGGDIELSVIISQRGEAQDIRVVKSLGKAFDEAAIAALRKTRFNPGTYKGQVVAVRATAVLHLSCSAYLADAVNPTTSDYTLAGGAKTHSHWKGSLTDCGNDPKLLKQGLCAPMLVNKTVSYVTEKDFKLAETSGTVILSANVDEQGFPRDIRIVTPAEEELNERAIALVRGWRYRPALYKGQPFTVRARLEVRFWSCGLGPMNWGLEP